MRIQSPWVVSLVRSDANRDDPEGGSMIIRITGSGSGWLENFTISP
jgi:hypothetical protein